MLAEKLENPVEIKATGKYLTTRQARDALRAAGFGRDDRPPCVVTVLRLARERGWLVQPRGKRGECFIDRAALEAFLKNGTG